MRCSSKVMCRYADQLLLRRHDICLFQAGDVILLPGARCVMRESMCRRESLMCKAGFFDES